MLTSKPFPTPLVVGTPLFASDGNPPVDASLFLQVFGGLQHLRMTRPNIAFIVNKHSHFMHSSTTTRWGAVKQLLRYLNDICELCIHLSSHMQLLFHGYCDANWGGN